MSVTDKVLSLLTDQKVLTLAQDLIRIPSPTESERDVAVYIHDLLKKEGFAVEYQEVSKGRPQVIARLKGSGGGRSLMFNGHIDNDSVLESWKWNPYEPRIEDNRLWGAGIHNMKSGVAAMIAAAIAVKQSGIPLKGDLVVACVVGELQGGKGTIHMLKSGVHTDVAIVPEPYSTNNIITKCVGVHKCAISTVGNSVHTSRSEQGVDAIKLMSKVMEALPRLDLKNGDADYPALPKINVASIIGGRSRDYDLAGPSNLPDYCTIIVDVRYSGSYQPEDIDKKFVELLETLKKEIPDFRYEYHHPPPPRFKVGGADMPPTEVPADAEIVRIVSDAHKQISGRDVEKIGIVLPYSYCGNDTAHLQRAGIPCCLYGPRGYADETEKHVRIDEMIECAKALAVAAVKVCA
ncbi:MAG TPA: M20/M25/M40 family metallo-hydrolase [Alphaproteobacteria bacterium]|nr:M20/M25/M40 family metallo-hydrolase [Alphaproteobacteria bacterium]